MVKNYKESEHYRNVGQTLWTDLEPVYDVKAVGRAYRASRAASCAHSLSRSAVRDTRHFTVGYGTQFRHVFAREWRLYTRNPAVTILPVVRGT